MVSVRDLFAESLGVDPREIEKRQAEEADKPSIGESISHGLGQVFEREENRLQQLMRHDFQAEGPVIPKAPATTSKAKGGPDLQR